MRIRTFFRIAFHAIGYTFLNSIAGSAYGQRAKRKGQGAEGKEIRMRISDCGLVLRGERAQ